MKFVGNIFALAFVVFLGYVSIDFDAKDPASVKPKTPTYSQFMTCDIGENWSTIPFFTGGTLLPGFVFFRLTDEIAFLVIGMGITFFIGIIPGTKWGLNMVRGR